MIGSLGAGMAFNPVTPFSPSSIAGLKLWLRADVGVTQSGGVVSAWADQSGQGNNFAQSTGVLQPPFNSSSIGGRPSVGGTLSKSMTCPTEPIAQNAARSMFLVLIAAPTSINTPHYAPRSGAGYCTLAGQSANGYAETNQTTTNCTMTATLTTTPIVYEMTFDGNQANLPIFKITGVATTLTNAVGSGVGAEGATAGVTIFGNGDATIAECLVYDTVLSSGNATLVRNYLRGIYSL